EDGSRDFDAANLRPELEGSLRRLQTDYIDILLVHSPPSEFTDGRKAPGLYAELEKLKTEGKIREYGVSLDLNIELETLINTTPSKAAEVMYNVLYQEPYGAFAKAQENGVGLIVKVPLDSGWLSGRYNRNAQFNDLRSRWPREVLERRASLVDKFAALVPPDVSLTHAALQFILAHPQVATVIPGAKSVAQALDNFAAAEQRLGPEVVQSIHDLWKRELEDNPLPW
ncbi:MAG TPA: aldo/keto reductase, partial [Bacillota bacterium]|nr:aldo/keto reductase [Bacillota bacterium]